MNTDPFTAAVQLGIIAYLKAHLENARKNDLAPVVLAALPPGSRLPIKVGDTLIGWLSVPQPRKTAEVISEAKFLAWVGEKHPTEIVTDPRVRPSFEALVLKSVKERGGWPDRETGELLTDIPGVTSGTGDPYPKVDLEDDAGTVIAAAWREGRVDLPAMLALPAAEGGDAA